MIRYSSSEDEYYTESQSEAEEQSYPSTDEDEDDSDLPWCDEL